MRSTPTNTDQMQAAWDGLDGERAVELSTRVLLDVTDGRLDPVQYFELLKAAMDPQADAPGGKPARGLHALRAGRAGFVQAEKDAAARAGGDLWSPGRVFWRSQPECLRTRMLHVLGAERPALEAGYANVRFLVDSAKPPEHRPDIARGDEAILELMRSPMLHPLVEEVVAAVSLLMAIIKRNKLKDASRAHLVNDCRAIVTAYVLNADGSLVQDIVVYPKTAALAAQGFYLFNEYGTPDDAALIAALYQLDVLTRLTHPRAQATCCLREMEWARHVGDLAAAKLYSEQAIVDLAPLRRHPNVVIEQGYLRAA